MNELFTNETIKILFAILGVVSPLSAVITIISLYLWGSKHKKAAKQWWDGMLKRNEEMNDWVSRAQLLDRELNEAKSDLKGAVDRYDVLSDIASESKMLLEKAGAEIKNLKELNNEYSNYPKDLETLQTAFDMLNEEYASKLEVIGCKDTQIEELYSQCKKYKRLQEDDTKTIFRLTHEKEELNNICNAECSAKHALARSLETLEYNLIEGQDTVTRVKDKYEALSNSYDITLKEKEGLKKQLDECKGYTSEDSRELHRINNELEETKKEVFRYRDLYKAEIEETHHMAAELVELEDSDVEKVLILWEAYDELPLKEKKVKILEVLLSEYKNDSEEN